MNNRAGPTAGRRPATAPRDRGRPLLYAQPRGRPSPGAEPAPRPFEVQVSCAERDIDGISSPHIDAVAVKGARNKIKIL
jgi:hypothetical protein